MPRDALSGQTSKFHFRKNYEIFHRNSISPSRDQPATVNAAFGPLWAVARSRLRVGGAGHLCLPAGGMTAMGPKAGEHPRMLLRRSRDCAMAEETWRGRGAAAAHGLPAHGRCPTPTTRSFSP